MRHLPLAALLLYVAGLAAQPMSESDLFFRVRAGQEILARGALPARNLYAFTYPDAPDIDTSWLFEVGAAALHRRGGFPALVLAKTAVLVGVFATAFALARRLGAGPVAAALTLAAAAFAARERFVERPHIFSLAGEVAVLFAVAALGRPGRAGAKQEQEQELDRRRAWMVFVLTCLTVVLWANLHAGVFLAAGLLALAAVGAAIDRDRRLSRVCRLLALAAVPAAFATPVGTALLRYLRLHLELPALHPVDEFRATTWISDAPLVVYGALALAAAVAARRAAFFLPAAALGLLAARSVRFGADFAVVAAPVAAAGLSALAARFGVRARPGVAGATAALLVALAVGPRVAAARRGEPLVDVGLDQSALPLDAIRFVNESGLRDRMYNDFEIGSYLLYEGYPRYRVFVDPRLPAYPPEMHRLLGRADLTRAEWDEAMRRHGVDSALLAYAGINRRVAWWDPAGWALVYRAHDARVFVRRLPRFRALIAAREIPATFAFTVEEGTATVPLALRPAASPVAACEWDRRLGELLFDLDGGVASPRARAAYERALAAPAGCLPAVEEARLCAWLGAVAQVEGRPARAVELIDRAIARGGEAAVDERTRAIRARAVEALGR